MRIVEQNRLALHATALYLYLFMCGLQKGRLQQVHLVVYMELVYAQPGRTPWAKLLLWSVHGMHILYRLTGL